MRQCGREVPRSVQIRHERYFQGNGGRNAYNDFVPLYYTLYRRKLIQGYGLLNKYKFEITLELDAKADEEYNRIIDVLRELESPERVFEYLTEIQSQLQTKEVTYISRASVAQLMADDYGE